jgi:hypothetical protein
MAVMMEQAPLIEDPRNHSEETRDRLRHLLASGVAPRPDAKHPGLFEIGDRGQVFYVFISRSTGKVTLLAVWDQDVEPCQAERVARDYLSEDRGTASFSSSL